MQNRLKLDYFWAGQQGQHNGWRVLAVIGLLLVPTLLIAALGQMMVLRPYLASLGDNETLMKSIAISVYMSILFGVAVVALAFGVKLLHKRPVDSLFWGDNRPRISDAVFGFVTYGAIMLAVVVLFDYPSLTASLAEKGSQTLLYTAVPFLIGFLIQGSAEEVVLRGYIPQVMTRALSRPLMSLGITALLFALLHLGYGLQSFITSLMFALFASFVVLQRGNLAEVCGAHAANNFLIVWLLSDIGAATESSGLAVNFSEIGQQLVIFLGFIAIGQLRQSMVGRATGLPAR